MSTHTEWVDAGAAYTTVSYGHYTDWDGQPSSGKALVIDTGSSDVAIEGTPDELRQLLADALNLVNDGGRWSE